MDDDAETYKLWRIRKTVMQVAFNSSKTCEKMHFSGNRFENFYFIFCVTSKRKYPSLRVNHDDDDSHVVTIL
jgi:hypothetical protein